MLPWPGASVLKIGSSRSTTSRSPPFTIVSPGVKRLARSVTTCSVAAPAGTITHATRGGRSAWTKSSSAVVPVAPSLAIALTPAGSDAYPTISWPPRIRRRAMLAPIRPSPTIPTCMESSSRLDGPAQQGQPGFHVAPEMHAQRPAPALLEDAEVTERLSGLHHTERIPLSRYREVVRVVTGDLDEHAGIRAALVRLPGRVQVARAEADTRRDSKRVAHGQPGRPQQDLVRLVHRDVREEGDTMKDRKSTRLNSSHLVISYAV